MSDHDDAYRLYRSGRTDSSCTGRNNGTGHDSCKLAGLPQKEKKLRHLQSRALATVMGRKLSPRQNLAEKI